MKARKLKKSEHYILVSAILGLIDSIKSYDKISIEKFLNFSTEDSFFSYSLSLSNADMQFLFKNLEVAWQEWEVTTEKASLVNYLDFLLQNNKNNSEYDFIHNNSLVYLLAVLNEELNPLYPTFSRAWNK